MERQKIIDCILDILYKKNLVPSKEIGLDESLVEKYDFTSIALIDMIVDIEDTFDFEFDDEDMIFEHFMTVNDIADIVSEML